MNKRNQLKIVNILPVILILNQAATGLLNDVIPHSIFEFFPKGAGVILFIIAFLHVYLNRAWVNANLLPGRKKSGK